MLGMWLVFYCPSASGDNDYYLIEPLPMCKFSHAMCVEMLYDSVR